MYRDFVMLPEKAWNMLVQWYGISEQGPVMARKVLIHNSIPSLELYPPRITCVLSDQEGKPIADSQRSVFVSSSLSLSEVHLKICDLFSYVSTKDTRLWCKGDSENTWTQVNNDTNTVKDGDMFMVEVKFYGN